MSEMKKGLDCEKELRFQKWVYEEIENHHKGISKEDLVSEIKKKHPDASYNQIIIAVRCLVLEGIVIGFRKFILRKGVRINETFYCTKKSRECERAND